MKRLLLSLLLLTGCAALEPAQPTFETPTIAKTQELQSTDNEGYFVFYNYSDLDFLEDYVYETDDKYHIIAVKEKDLNSDEDLTIHVQRFYNNNGIPTPTKERFKIRLYEEKSAIYRTLLKNYENPEKRDGYLIFYVHPPIEGQEHITTDTYEIEGQQWYGGINFCDIF